MRNMRVAEQLSFFSIGVALAVLMSFVTPLFSDVVFFLLVSIEVLFFIIMIALSRRYMLLRILFLGASVTSVLSAFVNFFSLGKSGIIQIPFDALVGLFRSILLASFFSLWERLTKFLEDRQIK